MRGIFFDAGNTLVLFDCEYLAGILQKVHGPVSAFDIREAEYKARFKVDLELLSHLEHNGTFSTITASMHSTGLWQSYFSTLLSLINVSEEKQPQIIKKLIQKEKATAKGLWHRLDPDIRSVLSELRIRGYFLGVISNSDGRLKQKFDDLQLAEHFDLILDSEDVGIEKPDARLFQVGLSHSRLRPDEALYVGDLYTIDVLAAKQAGMHSLLYDPAGLYENYEAITIRRWRDLLDALPKNQDQVCFLGRGIHVC